MSFVSMTRSRAIVLGTLLAFVGLVLLAVAANGSIDGRTFVLGGVLSMGGVVLLMTAFAMDGRRERAHVDDSDPRWHGGLGVAQLAGRRCVECGRKITVAAEALSCEQCAKPAHIDCQELHRSKAHPVVLVRAFPPPHG